jgi:hypothetical protein
MRLDGGDGAYADTHQEATLALDGVWAPRLRRPRSDPKRVQDSECLAPGSLLAEVDEDVEAAAVVAESEEPALPVEWSAAGNPVRRAAQRESLRTSRESPDVSAWI